MIERATIYSPGDPSVGIPVCTVVITGKGGFIDPEINPDYVEEAREILRKCFAELLDDGDVSVKFDFEED